MKRYVWRSSWTNLSKSEQNNFLVTGKTEKSRYAISRRGRSVILGICVAFVILAIWADRCLFRVVVENRPRADSQFQPYDFKKYNGRTFKVINVVDGDTIDIDIADGQYDKTRIRLWGVDTPETKSPQHGVMYYGPQASDFTTESVLGKNVTVYLEQRRTRGKYGRLLAYVQLEDGRYLNELLIQQGYGYADTRFKHTFYNKYKQLESMARRDKKGLWEEIKPQQMPEWRRKSNTENVN